MNTERAMTIVCGTDFSERSRSAMTVAVALAARLDATELWLVHVLDPTISSLDAAAKQALETASQQRLADEGARLAVNIQRGKLRLNPAVLVGPVSDTLLGFANEKQARLIVVSSQGHSSSFIHRVGGTSERLAQSAQLPVLVVGDDAPFEAWAKTERPLRLLLAVDWSRSCEAAIRWVRALRGSSGSSGSSSVDVVVGHVYNSEFPGDGPSRY